MTITISTIVQYKQLITSYIISKYSIKPYILKLTDPNTHTYNKNNNLNSDIINYTEDMINIKDLLESTTIDLLFTTYKFFKALYYNITEQDKESSIIMFKKFIEEMEELAIQDYDFENIEEYTSKINKNMQFKIQTDEMYTLNQINNDVSINESDSKKDQLESTKKNLQFNIDTRKLKLKNYEFQSKFKKLSADYDNKEYLVALLKFLYIDAQNEIKMLRIEIENLQQSKNKIPEATKPEKIKIFNLNEESYSHLKRFIKPEYSLDEYADAIMNTPEFIQEKKEEEDKIIKERKDNERNRFYIDNADEITLDISKNVSNINGPSKSEQREKLTLEELRKKDEKKELNIKGNTYRRG